MGLLVVLALALGACGGGDGNSGEAGDATQTGQNAPDEGGGGGDPRVSTVATGLDAPWEIAFLPDDRALITERPGAVRLLGRDGNLRPEPVARIDVRDVGEGGLLGMAVDPAFEKNGFVYVYRTTSDGNEVARYRLSGDELSEQATVVEGIPAGVIHNGGRIHFGPDDRLYVTTGDAGQSGLAQDQGSLAGKVLALAPGDYRGGGARPEIVSLGHRNPQGFDWQPATGRLVASEHGPSRNDEVNLIRSGLNYGWPEVQGSEHGSFEAPLRVYEDTTIAPSGATFVEAQGSDWDGDFLVAGLRGQQIRRLSIDGSEVRDEQPLFEGDHGRLRTVVQGPDDALYVLTNNRDGRGSPGDRDDRVLRVVPPGR